MFSLTPRRFFPSRPLMSTSTTTPTETIWEHLERQPSHFDFISVNIVFSHFRPDQTKCGCELDLIPTIKNLYLDLLFGINQDVTESKDVNGYKEPVFCSHPLSPGNPRWQMILSLFPICPPVCLLLQRHPSIEADQ